MRNLPAKQALASSLQSNQKGISQCATANSHKFAPKLHKFHQALSPFLVNGSASVILASYDTNAGPYMSYTCHTCSQAYIICLRTQGRKLRGICLLRTVMGICFSAPNTGSVNIITQFGKFKSVRQAGLSVIWPCIGEFKAGKVSLRLQSLTVRCETKTQDNVFVNIEVCVQYKVTDPEKFFYQLSDPGAQMKAFVFDVVRSIVPSMNLDDVFISKKELATAVQDQLRANFEIFGVAIMNTPVTDIDPPRQVKESMNEIVRQERLKIAARDEAERAKIRQVKAAEAQGEATRIQAGAEAEATYQSGVGMARQRHAILEGMKSDVEEWRTVPGMDAQAVVSLMLQTQYYNTMRDIGEGSKSTVFVPSSPNNVTNVAHV